MTENQLLDTSLCIRETPTSWCSKKEQVVALSSCEAEYIATSMCACQVVWLMNLMKGLSSEECEVMTLMINNVSIIILTKNLIAHGRIKHIEMRFHYLRELVSEEKLKLGCCKSEDQVDNLLTKGIIIEVFKKLKKHMSLEDVEELN